MERKPHYHIMIKEHLNLNIKTILVLSNTCPKILLFT